MVSPSNTQPSQKLPRPVFEDVFAFPPNRNTMGGTAYLIVSSSGNILIDCPGWDDLNQQFIQEQGGLRWLFLTHRGGIGKVEEIQKSLSCEVVIQEQEAYLLPGLTVTGFQHGFDVDAECRAIWTPGHSPGSSCLYCDRHGGILFSGRHLLPNQQGEPVPLRISKTFHWPRQIRSIEALLNQFTPETLNYICPGANTGFLRGKRVIDRAYQRLSELDLHQYLQMKPLM